MSTPVSILGASSESSHSSKSSSGTSFSNYSPGHHSPSLGSFSSKYGRRRSSQHSRDIEIAVYERTYCSDDDDGYSDHSSDDDSPPSPASPEDDIIMEGINDNQQHSSSQAEWANAKAKRKRTAREIRREERKNSLNRRKPVIVLKRDSGWAFSQEALIPSYMREQYSLVSPVSSASSSLPSAVSQGIPEDDEDAPMVTEIHLTPEDLSSIIP